jgi:hypothetical protein
LLKNVLEQGRRSKEQGKKLPENLIIHRQLITDNCCGAKEQNI